MRHWNKIGVVLLLMLLGHLIHIFLVPLFFPTLGLAPGQIWSWRVDYDDPFKDPGPMHRDTILLVHRGYVLYREDYAGQVSTNSESARLFRLIRDREQ